jgi:hypothetical protein
MGGVKEIKTLTPAPIFPGKYKNKNAELYYTVESVQQQLSASNDNHQ